MKRLKKLVDNNEEVLIGMMIGGVLAATVYFAYGNKITSADWYIWETKNGDVISSIRVRKMNGQIVPFDKKVTPEFLALIKPELELLNKVV